MEETVRLVCAPLGYEIVRNTQSGTEFFNPSPAFNAPTAKTLDFRLEIVY